MEAKMEIRMICQVVEWERRIEMENEKQGIVRPKSYSIFSINLDPLRNGCKSIFTRVVNPLQHKNLFRTLAR